MPGVLKVVRDGNFLAVIAEQRIPGDHGDARARRGRDVERDARTLPEARTICTTVLTGLPSQDRADPRAQRPLPRSARRRSRRPIAGPTRCTARSARPARSAQFDDGALTVWTHTPGRLSRCASALPKCCSMPPDERALHPCRRLWLLRPQRRRRCRRRCRAARARAARPAGARAMDARAGARLGAVRPGHGDRGANASLDAERQDRRLAIRRSGATPTRRGPAAPATCWPRGTWPSRSRRRRRGRSRCRKAAATATPSRSTAFPTRAWCIHFMPEMPLRVSALRALGAYMNMFSIESFMDELAQRRRRRSGRIPPDAISTTRAPATSSRRAAERSAGRAATAADGPRPRLRLRPLQESRRLLRGRDRGRGRTARPAGVRLMRAVAAVDSGEAVNPDGIRNQIEGGIVQSTSWTLYESVTFDRHAHHQPRLGRTIRSCASGGARKRRRPCHRPARPAVPRHRRGGAGSRRGGDRQCRRRATGVRLRDLPLTRKRIKDAIDA